MLSVNYGGNPDNPSTLCSSDHSLYDPPLPTLPFDLVAEILCRLPVKHLLQFQCICKSWKSLISDHKFAKKHLSLSITSCLHCIRYTSQRYPYGHVLRSYPLDPVFKNLITNITHFEYPPYNLHGDHPRLRVEYFVGSCNGILCFADVEKSFVILWNPCIKKFKEFPLFQKPNSVFPNMTFGFGYDSSNDNYKVAVILRSFMKVNSDNFVFKTELKVHTSSTNCWKNIQGFPFGIIDLKQSGKFLNCTINWLASIGFEKRSPLFIVSFDLEKESYQKVLLPDYEGVNVCNFSSLAVLRDCLCVTYGNGCNRVMKDVWVMKEYGNKESWTKLFSLSCKVLPIISHFFAQVVYIFEDDQVLLKPRWDSDSYVYNSRSGTLKIFTDFQNLLGVSYESLISPCS
jgi:F-box interacting protein